jgi:hypothetical protein
MANANIFEKQDQTIGGAFTAENCSLDLGTGVSATGAIVQRANFSIQRPINFIYELGEADKPQNVYYVGGRRRGEATFERIVGGSNVFKVFVDSYGPLCDKPGSNIVLTAQGGCPIAAGAPAGGGAAAPAAGRSDTVTYTLKTPKITTLGVSVSAQDIVIMESVQLVFLDLLYTGAGPAAGP